MTTPTQTPAASASRHTPELYNYAFDPLREDGRVEVRCNGVAIAEVQTINSAEILCRKLNAVTDLTAFAEYARNSIDAPHFNADRKYKIRDLAVAALAKLKTTP